MDNAVKYIDLGLSGRLVIIRAEEDGYPPKQTFQQSRDLFRLVNPELDDEEAVRQTMDAGLDLTTLKNAVEYIETLR